MGLAPNHPWYITKHGDQFITIRTDDLGGRYSTQDTIQVVHPSEVIPMSEIPSEEAFFQEYLPRQHIPQPSFSENPFGQNNTQPSGIQFNPVIKIVNGDDNSKNSGESAHNGMTGGGDTQHNSESIVPNTPYNDGGEKPFVFKAQRDQPKETDGGGGLLNSFKNFVIKKLT
jgi:hypothetical protein